MASYSHAEAARRAGVAPGFLDRLVELGIVTPDTPDRCTPGDVRRAMLSKSLEDAGIDLAGVAAEVRAGALSFAFLDTPAYERFAALAPETFRETSARTGIPMELLSVIREATGLAQPSPDDLLHEDELPVVQFVEFQVRQGFRPVAIERLLRVQGESTRRIADQEGAWWLSEVVAPAVAAGRGMNEVSNPELSALVSPLSEATVLAMYHAQQARVWTANIIETFEVALTRAGLHSRLERPPALCFLDITGYTRLTQEQGDDAAADLAAMLARLVRRGSIQHGGKPVKWLGDGVMLYFSDPGRGVHAALEMVDDLAVAGLPPAHVGLHAGPVLVQEGDYFGQTVNLTSRIADYARPGEVLVSQAVADAPHDEAIAFQNIGEVELKGVSTPVHLLRAHLA